MDNVLQVVPSTIAVAQAMEAFLKPMCVLLSGSELKLLSFYLIANTGLPLRASPCRLAATIPGNTTGVAYPSLVPALAC